MSTSSPKRRSRLSQERLGSAPSTREGRFLSQPRTRHSSELVRHPNSGGHITPTIFPRSLCWLCKRPSISVTRSSGSPRSPRACWRAEDLHWIDAETQALLESLVDSLPTARLLLLVNYRPEYQHGWGSKTYYTQLRLDPVPRARADALLDA